jgi:AcrR family transcriptional regulator
MSSSLKDPVPPLPHEPPRGLNGRRAQAARNDHSILAAARTVFLQSPQAPVAAVAKEAGVGISALYRRYPGKEQLLQKLCADGLTTFISIAEQYSDGQPDPFTALKDFVRGIVDADVHALTVKLAGTFTPTPELGELSVRADLLMKSIFQRAFDGGMLRADADANDVPMIFEQLTAIRLLDEARTVALRHRYLDLIMDGMRSNPTFGTLSAPAPSGMELGERWAVPQSA